MKVPVYLLKSIDLEQRITFPMSEFDKHVRKKMMPIEQVIDDVKYHAEGQVVYSVYHSHISQYARKEILDAFAPIDLEMFHFDPIAFGVLVYKDKDGHIVID